MEETNELGESLVEIEALLQNASDEIYNKIPKSFIEFIQENKSQEYKFEYNTQKSIEEQNFSELTLGLIGLIYKDFVCNEEEKLEYQKEIDELRVKIEKEKREKYNPDNIFKNQIENQQLQQNEESRMIVVQETK